MRKHLRHLRRYATGLGLKQVKIEKGGKHPQLLGTAPDGTEIRYVVPGTPSDGARGEANVRADLRRLLKPPSQRVRKVGIRTRKRPRRPRLPGMPPAPVRPVVAKPSARGLDALGEMFDQAPLDVQFALLMEDVP